MRRFVIPLVGIASLVVLALPVSAGVGASVTVVDFAFNPPTASPPLTATVTWDNAGSFDHTATSNVAGFFNTGTIHPTDPPAEVFFQLAGTFGYHCQFHPDLMRGKVKVAPVASTDAIVLSQSFTLTYAGLTVPHRAVDLQRRFNGGSWVTFRTGLTNMDVTITPKKAGTFDYRAHTTNTNSGKSSGWSPFVTVVVSAG